MCISVGSLLLLLIATSVLGASDHSSTRRWRCRRHAERCAVLYHAFVPAKVAAAFPPSPHLLMAAVSASTLAHAHRQQQPFSDDGGRGETAAGDAADIGVATPPGIPFRIVLATNAPRSAIERFRSAWTAVSNQNATAVTKAPPGGLAKDEAETFAFVVDTWSATMAAGVDGAAATPKRFPPWPFHDVALYPLDTVYTLKAIAFDATVVAGAPGSTVESLSGTPLRFERTMFLDSDTLVRGSIEPALDALIRFDVAAVGELASFSPGAPYLYRKLLNASNFYHPHVPAAMKAKPEFTTINGNKYRIIAPKKKFKSIYKSFPAYEQQYNTGLVAYRSTAPCVRELIQRWEVLHMSNPICRKDVVAWDQCSFPWALRESPVRVATLPERLNFRRALGQACSAELQDGKGLEKASVVHEVKPGLKALVRLVLAPVLLSAAVSQGAV